VKSKLAYPINTQASTGLTEKLTGLADEIETQVLDAKSEASSLAEVVAVHPPRKSSLKIAETPIKKEETHEVKEPPPRPSRSPSKPPGDMPPPRPARVASKPPGDVEPKHATVEAESVSAIRKPPVEESGPPPRPARVKSTEPESISAIRKPPVEESGPPPRPARVKSPEPEDDPPLGTERAESSVKSEDELDVEEEPRGKNASLMRNLNRMLAGIIVC
jgi:hypothetical protein